MVLTRDVKSTALVGSHAGHTKVRQATGHLPQGQLNCVGAWLVQLGFIHYQRVDLSFLWEMGRGRQLCGGRGLPDIHINFPVDSLSRMDKTFTALEWGRKKKDRNGIRKE